MSHDNKAHGFKCSRSRFCIEFGTVGFDLFACGSVRAMDVVCTEKAYNKSLIYSGTEALSKLSTGWGKLKGQETNSFDKTFVEFPSGWDVNVTTVESERATEVQHNYQTNAKYNVREITNTITNTKYQTVNKCQTDGSLPECLQKYRAKELEVQKTKEQMIIEVNPTIPEQLVNAFIEEKREKQNKIPVQLSSNCQYRNADKNVNVRVLELPLSPISV